MLIHTCELSASVFFLPTLLLLCKGAQEEEQEQKTNETGSTRVLHQLHRRRRRHHFHSLPTRLLLAPSLTHLAKVDTLTPAVHAPAASISLAPTRLRVAPFKRPGPPSSSQEVINACLLLKRPSRLPRLGSGGGKGRGLKRTRRVEETGSRRRKWDGCGIGGKGCYVQR